MDWQQFFDAIYNLLLTLRPLWDAVYGALPVLLPLAGWCVWWLWAVNWRKCWPVLAGGAWMPALLLVLVAAMVWARLAPADCSCLGPVTIPNGWWQLGAAGGLACLALFCGWLQGYFGWTPEEVSVEPPPVAPDHHHGHAHGHH